MRPSRHRQPRALAVATVLVMALSASGLPARERAAHRAAAAHARRRRRPRSPPRRRRPPRRRPTPGPTFELYTVKRGDTLTSIAKRFKTDARSIAYWNRGRVPVAGPGVAALPAGQHQARLGAQDPARPDVRPAAGRRRERRAVDAAAGRLDPRTDDEPVAGRRRRRPVIAAAMAPAARILGRWLPARSRAPHRRHRRSIRAAPPTRRSPRARTRCTSRRRARTGRPRSRSTPRRPPPSGPPPSRRWTGCC